MTISRRALAPEQSAAILLWVDPASLAIHDVSKPTLALLGYRREELLGRPITDIECGLTDAFFWEDWKESPRGGPHLQKHAEGSYRCASGDLMAATKIISLVADNGRDWLQIQANPLRAGAGLEEQLAITNSLLQATLEATADGILLTNREGKIINMNRRCAQMWGLPEPLLTAHHDDAVYSFMAELFAEPGVYRQNLAETLRLVDGETFDILELMGGSVFARKSRPAQHGRHIMGRVFSFTDITAQRQAETVRVRLEEQLRESQKMEAIGTLAGGIAHDFNNILATIMGNTELAKMDAQANPLALESLVEISKAATRARDLVQQILSFSRRQPTDLKLVALAPVTQESVRLLKSIMPARITIDLQCDQNVPRVRADATQIEQIVINLATNAMQAMQHGVGRINVRLNTLSAEVIAAMLLTGTCSLKTLASPILSPLSPALRALFEAHPGREMVRITVADNGPGIDAVTLTRIFEPFFTTKPVGEGTGLGLSVVHGIVQGHGGAIAVESELGRETRFCIYLLVPGELGDNAFGSEHKVLD